MMNAAAAETADSLIAYLHDIDGAAIKILAAIIENLVAIAVYQGKSRVCRIETTVLSGPDQVNLFGLMLGGHLAAILGKNEPGHGFQILVHGLFFAR